jgi:hypothetical protein
MSETSTSALQLTKKELDALKAAELAAAKEASKGAGDNNDHDQTPPITQQQAQADTQPSAPSAPLIAIGPHKVEPVEVVYSRTIPLALGDDSKIFVLRRRATTPGVVTAVRPRSSQPANPGAPNPNNGTPYAVTIKGVKIAIETLRSTQAGAAVDATYRRVHLNLIAQVPVKLSRPLVDHYPLFTDATRQQLSQHVGKDVTLDLSACTFTVSMNASGPGAHVLRLSPGFNPLNKQGFCQFNLDVARDMGNINTALMGSSVLEATVKAMIEVGQYFDVMVDEHETAIGVLNERGIAALDSPVIPQNLKDMIMAFQQMPTEAAVLSEAYNAVLSEYTERLAGYNPVSSNNDLGAIPVGDLAQRLAAAMPGASSPETGTVQGAPSSEGQYIPTID